MAQALVEKTPARGPKTAKNRGKTVKNDPIFWGPCRIAGTIWGQIDGAIRTQNARCSAGRDAWTFPRAPEPRLLVWNPWFDRPWFDRPRFDHPWFDHVAARAADTCRSIWGVVCFILTYKTPPYVFAQKRAGGGRKF